LKRTEMRVNNNGYKFYLVFMLIACSGAFIWQFCLPNLAGQFSSWGYSIGWQREIALWNIGIISAITVALVKNDQKFLQILTFQSTILCWLLGINHLISLLQDFSLTYTIHILGIFEVLLVGGIWGTILLYRTKRQTNKIYLQDFDS
jgi:KinB signaling pathway activation protein